MKRSKGRQNNYSSDSENESGLLSGEFVKFSCNENDNRNDRGTKSGLIVAQYHVNSRRGGRRMIDPLGSTRLLFM